MKTLSKPLADRFKNFVMSHPEHRRSVLRVADVAHRMEIGITRRAEGREGKAFIGSMTEEKSVELASKIASEGFVFAVGAGGPLGGVWFSAARRGRASHPAAWQRAARCTPLRQGGLL